jgi:hypothetical protein
MATNRFEGLGKQLQMLLGWAFLLGIGYAILNSFGGLFWGEETGEVKYGDCRNNIMVEEGAGSTWFKKFTCTYVKSQSGKILRGTCVHVETEGAVCQTAYIYEKKPQMHCTDPKLPYPGFDDMCHSEFQ